MLKFFGMDPINPLAGNPLVQDPTPQFSGSKKTDNRWVTVLSVALFILSALGIIIFLYNQNQTLKDKLSGYQDIPTPTSVSTPSSKPSMDVPVVSSPSAGSKVKSPLKVSGKIPAGWMFEGTFPVKLFDSDRNLIAQVGAKEVVPGSWQTGGLVEFTATITFRAATGSGTLVLENDNPSGDPINLKIFEIPVTF